MTMETFAKISNACVDNKDFVVPGNNIWTEAIGITIQDGISNIVEENTEDIVAVHQA